MPVIHLDGVAFDSDTAFAFKVHVIQDLSLGFTFVHRAGKFEQTVGKSALAVINVGDNAKVTYVLHRCKGKKKFDVLKKEKRIHLNCG